MKNLFLSLATLLVLSLSTSAQLIDLSKSRIIVDNKEITLTELDSLAKQYPSFSIKSDNNTTPPTAYIKFNTKAEIDSLQKTEANTSQQWLGKSMPNFSIKDISNNLITSESLRGKVVVFNFYFTACTPCIREIPELNKLVKQFEGKNVVFIAFALNDEKQLKNFLHKNAFDYTQVANAKDITENDFKVSGWPTHFIFDETGITHYYSQGFKESTLTEIKNILSQLVK